MTQTTQSPAPPTDLAVEVHGLTQELRHRPRAARPRPDGSRRPGHRVPRARTAPGKSTTIRILLGLLRADGGRATVLGGDPWADAVRLHRSIAYVPGDVTLWPNLTGGEAIDILCRLSGPLDPRRKQVMLDRFDLDPTKKARTYSKGNRQKVALVAALASTRRAAPARRADLGPRPADGGGVHRVDPRGEGRGPLGAAVQPHLRRGREARRPGDDHPRRRHRRVGHHRRSCAT